MSVRIKVSWLKQKIDDVTNQPLLEFDEQQFSSFDPRCTTFRMVKHACSYPAPPHKVRMWCSSLGAQPDLPSVMDLNMFINTFELITEERHTLEMAHLTGGETIAFEMVQSDQMSELSGFLLGNTKAGLKGPVLSDPAAFAPGKPGGDDKPMSKEQAAKAEAERSRLAEELIAEEEEEARRKENQKAKKKKKKDKQKEKKKAVVTKDGDDDGDETDKDPGSDENEPEPEPAPAPAPAPASGSAAARRDGTRSCASGGCGDTASSQPTTHRASAPSEGAGGAGGTRLGGGAMGATRDGCGACGGGGGRGAATMGGGAIDTGSAASGADAPGGGTGGAVAQVPRVAQGRGNEVSGGGDVAEELRSLQLQLRRSEDVIHALIAQCLEERRAKESALEEVQNLQDQSLAMQAQDEEVARMQEHLLSHSMRQKGGGGSLAYSR